MRRALLLSLALLAACDALPVESPASGAPETGPALAVAEPPAAILSAPYQRADLAIDGSFAEAVWFRADIRAYAEGSSGGAAQMDGAILVVSAVDGPMPQRGWSLQIAVRQASLGSDGVVRFLGEATLVEARGDATTFAVSGTAAAGNGGVGDPDLIFDILGGQIHTVAVSGTYKLIDRSLTTSGVPD